jgi:hypothetical protein
MDSTTIDIRSISAYGPARSSVSGSSLVPEVRAMLATADARSDHHEWHEIEPRLVKMSMCTRPIVFTNPRGFKWGTHG